MTEPPKKKKAPRKKRFDGDALLTSYARKVTTQKLPTEQSEFRARQSILREDMLLAAARRQHREELDRITGALASDERHHVPHVLQRFAALKKSVPVFPMWNKDIAPPLK
jgi:FMN-dependent NADH-azoreductase